MILKSITISNDDLRKGLELPDGATFHSVQPVEVISHGGRGHDRTDAVLETTKWSVFCLYDEATDATAQPAGDNGP